MRHLERAVVAVLGVWCVVGVVHTAGALLGPAGWTAGRPQAESGFVGMPLPSADAVVSIGRLLDIYPDADDPALVILPPGLDPTRELYIRYQLAHTQFPRVVDVLGSRGGMASGRSYATVVAAVEMRLEAPWRVTATLAGFSMWEQGEP